MGFGRMRVGPLALGAGAFGLLLSACQDPTQIRVDVRTSGLACDRISGTRLTSGPPGESPTARHETSACVDERIGDIVYAPSTDKEGRLRLQVSLGIDGKTAAACEDACGDDCIIARRLMSFVPRQKLFMPITAEPSCIDVCCLEDETCVGGFCVSAEIEPCRDDGEDCPDPDGGGGAGGAGGGGGAGGAGGGGPTVADEVVDIVPLGAPQAGGSMAMVGHRLDPNGAGIVGFVYPSDPPNSPYQCVSDAGEVRFAAAEEVQGDLVVVGVGVGRGRVDCGQDLGNPDLVDDYGSQRGAFILRLDSGLDSTTGYTIARWDQGGRFVVGGMGATQQGSVGLAVDANPLVMLEMGMSPSAGVTLLEVDLNGALTVVRDVPTSVPPTRFEMVTQADTGNAFLALEMPAAATATPIGMPLTDDAPFVAIWTGALFGDNNPMWRVDRWTSDTGVELLTVGDTDLSAGMIVRSSSAVGRDDGDMPPMGGSCVSYATAHSNGPDPSAAFSLFANECDDGVMARGIEGEVRKSRILRDGGSWQSNWMEMQDDFTVTVDLPADGMLIQAAYVDSSRLWISGLAEAPLKMPSMGTSCPNAPAFRAPGPGKQPFYMCFE